MTLEETLNLPDDLEYSGEFGPELVLALPFYYWLSLNGLLKNRRIVTYSGMTCFYDDLGCREIVEKVKRRAYVRPPNRASWLPVKNEHTFDVFRRSPFHIWPNLRDKFKKLPMLPDIGTPDRPILVVHNKYCNEWGQGPINFLSVPLLRTIFSILSNLYTVVYIRHGVMAGKSDYADDHNTSLDFDDQTLMQEYPNVKNFDDLYKNHRELGGKQDFNTFKNILYSRCHHYISSQGGGAHQIALFSGSLLMVMHRRGSEIKWAYNKGYYNFMADVPPMTLICRNEEDMVRSLPAFVDAPIVGDRVWPRADLAFITSMLFPQR